MKIITHNFLIATKINTYKKNFSQALNTDKKRSSSKICSFFKPIHKKTTVESSLPEGHNDNINKNINLNSSIDITVENNIPEQHNNKTDNDLNSSTIKIATESDIGLATTSSSHDFYIYTNDIGDYIGKKY